MSAGAKKLIRSIQPYETGDKTLWHIHKLDIVDKHRLLITASLAFGGWTADVVQTHKIYFDRGWTFPLIEGQQISNIPTSTYNRQKHNDFKLQLDITFGESEVSPRQVAANMLKCVSAQSLTRLPLSFGYLKKIEVNFSLPANRACSVIVSIGQNFFSAKRNS
jgi:hypothetical protein